MDDEPLWQADNQEQRLNELLGIPPEIKEAPLRRDVRSLGRLLGNVIREQEGDALFGTVEALRRVSIAERADQLAFAPSQAIVQSASIADAAKLAKAFALYFELTNLAETNHRKRRRRAAQLSPQTPKQPGTFKGTPLRARNSGIRFEEIQKALRRIHVVPVFTAHPTEVARRTVLWKRQRISGWLEELDHLPLVSAHVMEIQQQITAEITALWQTNEVRREAPTVLDEIQMGLDYSPVLFETVPQLYDEVVAAIDEVYGARLDAVALPRLVEFGSWIGGDRDGNPAVT